MNGSCQICVICLLQKTCIAWSVLCAIFCVPRLDDSFLNGKIMENKYLKNSKLCTCGTVHTNFLILTYILYMLEYQ